MSEETNDVEQLIVELSHCTNELYDIWQNRPLMRDDFGVAEVEAIDEAKDKLSVLQQFILVYALRKVRAA